MISGRVEALASVPTGGAAVSASNSGGGATTVTVPAGGYFLSSSGVQSSLISTLQSQLNSSRAPSSGSWTVSLSTTTGLVSIGCTGTTAVPSFSLDWTNTTLRDLLGFTKNINYPATAAEMQAIVGGDWTTSAGFLCNEASGALAAAFGTALTMAPNGSVAYGITGPRGGTDKAVAMDATNEGFSETTNALGDVNATSDLILLAVIKTADVVATDTHMFSKSDFAGGAGYTIRIMTDEKFRAVVDDGPDITSTDTASAMPIGEWCVVALVAERATNRLRCGFRSLSSSSNSVSPELDISLIGSMSNTSPFRICRNGTIGGELQVAALYIATGVGAATGLSANLSTALSNFAATFGTWTGTKQARGLWFPDCPLNVGDSDPRMAPVGSDARTSVTGSGARITHVGVYHRKHRSVVWSHVPIDRIREQSATYANASFRTFWDDTQIARGPISWFKPGSSLLIVDHNGNVLGQDMQTGGPTEGWGVTDPRAVEPRRVNQNGWTGLWRVEISELIAKDA